MTEVAVVESPMCLPQCTGTLRHLASGVLTAFVLTTLQHPPV
jgi:hypothetical protein